LILNPRPRDRRCRPAARGGRMVGPRLDRHWALLAGLQGQHVYRL